MLSHFEIEFLSSFSRSKEITNSFIVNLQVTNKQRKYSLDLMNDIFSKNNTEEL